jgi:hypothetical protein
MLTRLFLASIVGLALSATATQASIISTATYNGHTYHLITEQSWTSAQAEAVTLGGNLVTINDAAENAFLTATFTTPLFPGDSGTFWIGFNDVGSEGTFEWVSGEPVTYTNWNIGEPNNLGDEDFVHLHGPGGPFGPIGTWNDEDGPFRAVVEVVPEPASVAVFGIGVVALAAIRRRRTRS